MSKKEDTKLMLRRILKVAQILATVKVSSYEKDIKETNIAAAKEDPHNPLK